MIEPGIPDNEAGRLAALDRYEVMDTAAEDDFDDLVQLAARICGAPISLVSLVDGDRQWFKARVGLDAEQTPRALSFCGHAVASGELLVVPDASADARFRDNPLVVGVPNIGFYAGAPLTTDDGYTLGTLCIIDHAPRHLTEAQLDSLIALSRVVVRQLELRVSLSRQRAHDERLAAALAKAERETQAKSRFLAHMSHELRTPLNSVIGFTRILARDKERRLDDKQHLYLERIEDNGKHLLALINDILDLSKVESGETDLVLEDVDLGQLLEGLSGQCLPLVEDAGNTLRIDVPHGLTPLCADRLRMTQLLTNLLSNANKFTSEGTLEIRVIVDDNEPTRATRIDVIDSGIGIDAVKIDEVFEPFRQASEGIEREFGGTGLGLPICRGIAQAHGFDVSVVSVVGVGSTFSVLFNLAAAPNVHRVARAATVPPGCREPQPERVPREGATVLGIDGDKES